MLKQDVWLLESFAADVTFEGIGEACWSHLICKHRRNHDGFRDRRPGSRCGRSNLQVTLRRNEGFQRVVVRGQVNEESWRVAKDIITFFTSIALDVHILQVHCSTKFFEMEVGEVTEERIVGSE